MAVINFDLREYKKLTSKQYRKEKERLQVELLKLQAWVIATGQKVAIVFEGRDTAGKGSTIKRFIENLIERKTTDDVGYRVVSLGVPSQYESTHWFERYEHYLPKEGELVFFDRSWYNRALVEPVMGYCNEQQYREFIGYVNSWEDNLQAQGILLIKIYLLIDKHVQQRRLKQRKESPVKYWKLSDHDLLAMGKWEVFSFYEQQMFSITSPAESPWVVINANNKMIARLNAIRYVLENLKYDKKVQLKPKKWNVERRSLSIDGVAFNDLNSRQFELLLRLKRLNNLAVSTGVPECVDMQSRQQIVALNNALGPD